MKRGKIDAFVHDTPVLQAALFADPTLAEVMTVLPRPIRSEEYGIAVKRPKDPNARNLLREQIYEQLLSLKVSGQYAALVTRYLGN